MQLVLDTNVVISAIFWGGKPRQLLGAAQDQSIAISTSPALIAELEAVLLRSKFEERLTRVDSTAEEIIGDYISFTEIVYPLHTPRVVPNDPDDDHVLACALEAHMLI